MKNIFSALALSLLSLASYAQNEFVPTKNYEFNAKYVAAKKYKTAFVKVSTNSYGSWSKSVDACKFKFDAKGNVTSFKKLGDYIYAFQMNDTKEFVSAELTYENGNISFGQYQDKQSTTQTFKNKYDAKGRIIEHHRIEKADKSDYSISRFTYNADGKLAEMYTENYFDGSKRPIGTYISTYSYSGNKVTYIMYAGKKRKEISEKEELTYNSNGQLTKRVIFQEFDEKTGLEVANTYTYTYDSKGRLSKFKREPSTRNLKEKYGDNAIKVVNFTYGDDNLVKEVIVHTVSDDEEHKMKGEFTYSMF